MNTDTALARAYRTNKIIGAAMVGTVLIYAIIVEVLKLQNIVFTLIPDQILDKLRFIFVFFSFAAYFLINFFRKKLLVKKIGDSQETLIGKLTLTNIVSLVFSELPALFGLILFLASGNSRDFYLLMIMSAVLLYTFFPRYNFWAAWSQIINQDTP